MNADTSPSMDSPGAEERACLADVQRRLRKAIEATETRISACARGSESGIIRRLMSGRGPRGISRGQRE